MRSSIGRREKLPILVYIKPIAGSTVILYKMIPIGPEDDQTHFLNVDLVVWSRSPLDELVAAFGKRVDVLYVGSEGRRYGAHVELASVSKSVDALVRGLARLVTNLPETPRALWDRAQRREFNIGIQAGHEPHCHELRLKPDTLEAVVSLNARIVVTTYAALPPPRVRHTHGA